METYLIINFVIIYIIFGLMTLSMYRCQFEDDYIIKKLNPDNARNIRVYLRLVVLVLWPLVWLGMFISGLVHIVPLLLKTFFKGIYNFIFE